VIKSRRREIVRPRQIAMYLSRLLTQRSYPEIAQRFNKMDHTTVMHGCDQIKKMCGEDPTFAAEVDKIKRSIRDWQDSDETK
jgi:chromosomal replication initiator protein